MATATPHTFRDTCHHCGQRFEPSESRWVERRAYMVHTRCADWSSWEGPPYVWKLKELRRQYREADETERVRIVRAGKAIRAMQRVWPEDAAEHVGRVLEACRGLSS